MKITYKQTFIMRHREILRTTEKLLIENYDDITIDELALELDVAKGTIYKHFKSKNQLYLELLIQNEKKLLKLAIKNKGNFKKYISKFMIYSLLNANRTILFHIIEEKLTNTETGLKDLFHELYKIRNKRLIKINKDIERYIKSNNIPMTSTEYLPFIWTTTYGAALLLNSSHYQKYIWSRDILINSCIYQVLNIVPNKRQF